MQEPAFEPGQRVEKLTGYYKDEATVLGAVYTQAGDLLYIIETSRGDVRTCRPRALVDPIRKHAPVQLDLWDS